MSCWIFLRTRNISNKIYRQNQNTYFTLNKFFPESRAVCEIMSKNMVDPEKLQILWRMRVTCWISEATRAKSRARASTSTFTQAPTLARERAHTHRNINMLHLLLFHGNSVSVTRLSVTIRALPVPLKSHVQYHIHASVPQDVHVVLRHKDR